MMVANAGKSDRGNTMKRTSPSEFGFINARNLLGVFLCLSGISLAILSLAAPPAHPVGAPATSAAGPSPGMGTLKSTNIGTANAISYADTVGSSTNDTFFAGNGTCAAPTSCSTFTLTIDPSVGTASGSYDPTKYSIFIELAWPQAAEDYDTFICSTGGNCVQANVIASNTSTADPETITLPTTTPPGVYTINAVMATGAFEPYTGTAYLKPIPQNTTCTGNCTPPRYINYPAGQGQADNAGEPSVGVDWNPNVASLKDTSSRDFTTGIKRLNTGGVAFFKSGGSNWRVNFDDCPSPAVNKWEDVSATFDQQFVLTDPIGFVDHYSSSQLGLAYPPPKTPGRVFTLDLIGGQGNSLGAYSDNDGNSYLPGANGGPGQGPDHETLGGGPYNPNSTPPPPPQTVAYGSPNAIYYCSQNIVAEAQCSRSDNGGQTFGPGVPIFNPAQCTGGIHGHVKVARDGTVYVPNSSCGTVGSSGVAVSTDNGLTWTENNVPGSTSTQDPSVGIGQNDVGKPGTNLSGTNTIYIGYVDGDGHAKVAHSGDRGAHWSTSTDVGVAFGITHAVFPVVVAGDDDRAAFGFLGTGKGINNGGTCDPYGTGNCANIWHLYIATTYDGGANWITIDATPNDPVQQGVVCLQGTLCAGGRNLLDFNDFSVDAEGRGVLGYADGCINCNNTFGGQSSASHGTIARQSGGRRLFAAFDPIEPAPPASPQMVSVVSQAGGALVTWLEPDNGGSPITGYNVYRGTTSGAETLLAHVSGETTTKYFDPSPPSGTLFYYATAINTSGEGQHCGEISVTACLTNCGTKCTFPYLNVDPAGSPGNVSTDPTQGELTIEAVNIGEPFAGNCNEKSITFLMQVKTLDPAGTGMPVLPANSEWQILFGITDTNGNPETVYVSLDTFSPNTPATPAVSFGRRDACSTGCSTLDSNVCTAGGSTMSTCPAISVTETAGGTIQIKLNVATPLSFPAPGAPGVGSAFTWDASKPGTILGTSATKITGNTLLFVGVGAGFLETVQTTSGGTYTTIGNVACNTIAPVAALTATPLSGNAPLTVHFDASASKEPTGACGTINSYTLNFGDGSAPVTQSTPTFTHTYIKAGSYPAKLTVGDTAGKVSTNLAQQVITVNSSKPNVSIGAFPIQIHEGASATYTVFVSPAPSQSITVPYSRSGTASLTSDYTLSGTLGKVTILAGKTSASFTLQALSDKDETTESASEKAIMTLQAGTSYNLVSPKTATVTILK
jgi:PKD repeat protein